MKKLLGILGISVLFLTGCNGDKNDASINVYTRDTDSGTREGFFTAIDGKSAKGNNEFLISGVSEVSSNGDMINKVKNDENGIGYISLTSLEDSGVKGLKFEGVEATEANVLNDTYKMSRDFAFTTINDDTTEGKLVKEFNKFLDTTDGEAALISAGVIVDANATDAYTAGEVCTGTVTDINIGGSTSVEKAAKALSTALANKCAAFKAVHAHTGSGDSEKVGEENESMHIGFSSSGIRSGWKDTNVEGVLGQDAIVVVVNNKNELNNVTKVELQEIFIKFDAKEGDEDVASNTSNKTKWNELSDK